LQQYDGTQWLDVWQSTAAGGGSSVTYNSYAEYALELHNESVANYNQTVVSIAPNMPYGNSDDAARDLAICWVCSQIVATLCQQEIDRRAADSNIITVMGTSALALIAAAAAIVTGGLTLAIIGVTAASGAIAIRGVSANLSSLSKEFLSDRNAQNVVACAMAARIKGTALSEAIFAASINTADYSANSTAVAIGTALIPAMSDEQAYIDFMAACESAFGYAKLNLLTCPCNNWIYEFDFTQSNGGFNVVLPASTYWNRGEWVSGLGWRSGGDFGRYLTIERNFQGVEPVSVGAHLLYTTRNTENVGATRAVQYTNSLGQTVSAALSNSTGTFEAQTSFNFADISRVQITLHSGLSTVTAYHYATRLRLLGTGSRPNFVGGQYIA
jgi:hypothetical protein